MKNILKLTVTIILSLLIAGIMPAQVFADSVPEYISEVRIGMGKDAKEAEEALEEFIILSDENGNPVDLNQKAGGGTGSKGEKVIYLGYKTTTKRSEAITDLALMNMEGGYSVQDYEILMETQMKSQIIPFVDNFKAALEEYRVNYNSENTLNKARAQYVHDALNLLTDDDCGGKGLGDLLLNETRYEMGEDFDRLPAEEKSNHADILTILAQSNGKATLIMENLITRAADTDETTWLDRFSSITYDELANMIDALPTDADAELAKLYEDTARKLLDKWDDFSEELASYDEAYKTAESFDADAYEEAADSLENLTGESSEEQMQESVEEFARQQIDAAEFIKSAEIVAIHSALENTEYGECTLLDFFSKPKSEIEDDISVLYPLAASLSEGQIAGLDFVSMRELFAIALTDETGYEDQSFENSAKTSIYDGVDRGIYQKGGVALTSDALRKDAISRESEDGGFLSPLTITMYVLSGLAAAGLLASGTVGLITKFKNNIIDAAKRAIGRGEAVNIQTDLPSEVYVNFTKTGDANKAIQMTQETFSARTALCGKLAIGFCIAMIVIAGISTYYAYLDLVEFYKVEFTPIPRYMVDEADITVYNEHGEKTVIKNQAAYYKAIECNRNYKDEMFESLGECADLNGDVGRQWLALYAQKSDAAAPILAESLLVKVNDGNLPAGYTTGIHMFGSGSAFNLNSELYDWNKSAPSVMVYFKTDTAAKSPTAAGSSFTAGNLILAGVAGLSAGALISALALTTVNRKKKQKAA